jgi:flagellar basal-body rod modification protein FlgD
MQVGSMTSTNPVSSSASGAATTASSTAAAGTVDYNSFLQLLVQEMKNQDPTSPSDPTQYLSQLASFSNVEQAVQTNTKLDTMLTMSSLTQAENVIGKTVTSLDGSTTGKVSSVALASGGAATATLDNGSTLTLDSSITVSG